MIDQDTTLVPWEPARQQIMHLPYPVWKVQRRSKRVFTLWVVRPTPEYWSHRNFMRDVDRQSEYFKLMWGAECRAWRKRVAQVGGFECIAIWPSTHWVHLTIKVNWWDQPYDKEASRDPIVLGDWELMQGIPIPD